MMNSNDSTVNRRTFLNAGALGAGSVVLANAFEPCPEPTRQNQLGPFFRPQAPFTTNLIERDMKNNLHISLYGRVLDEQCRPVRSAVLKIWQADAHGTYDCTGYRLRGNVKADEDGQYHVQTIFPAAYDDLKWGKRCPHIHFMVGLPNRPKLITQLFFRGTNTPYREKLQAMNREDSLYHKDLAVRLVPSNRIDGLEAEFDFVINTTTRVSSSIPGESGCAEKRQGR